MSLKDAAIAVNRFGLGARPGELEAAAGNPRRWLLEQLEGEYTEPKEFAGFMNTAQHRENFFYRYSTIGFGLNARQERAKAAGDTALVEKLAADIRLSLRGYVTWVAENFMLEYAARTNVALTTDQPFRERLARFWSNHLVVPSAKQQCSVICGAYEREVIRPHTTGKFADMLMASAKNPAMLVFLDNHVSVGPGSKYGRESGHGLNENLAREILELHTMGVEGGYTQADVIELAKAITGWTSFPAFEYTQYLAPQHRGATPGGFEFQPDWHEPGARSVVGKSYPAGGVGQGEAILSDLARHPSTARYLATKLATHFISDEPSREIVERLAQVYLANDTDLAEMTRALVETPEAWNQAQAKIKQPEDYALSCYRALDLRLPLNPAPPMQAYNFDTYKPQPSYWAWMAKDPFNILDGKKDLAQFDGNAYARAGAEVALFYADIQAMGQSPLNAPGPQGWYDRWGDWSGADSMIKRVEWSLALAAKRADRVADTRKLVRETLGPLAADDLATSVARAATPDQALGLLLASPDFQRR